MSVSAPWDAAALQDLGKKEIIDWVREHASFELLKRHRLNGAAKNVNKNTKKDAAVAAYNDLIATGAFSDEETRLADEAQHKLQVAERKATAEASVVASAGESAAQEVVVEEPQYTFETLKKGDKLNFPKKGDKVLVQYVGTLEDGTQFDSSWNKKKKRQIPIQFKVGTGQVIKGWDHALQRMSAGERAKIVVQPSWAYGDKGRPDAGIPPSAVLIFELELMSII